MSRRLTETALLILLYVAAASPLRAELHRVLETGNEVVVGNGAAGLFDGRKRDIHFVQYRSAREWHRLRPWVGVDFYKGGAWWAGAGLRYELMLSRSWLLTMSFAPGYYNDGGVLPLGDKLEFVSSLEVSAEIWRGARVGASLGHISNGGLNQFNPGSEIARFFLTVPIGR